MSHSAGSLNIIFPFIPVNTKRTITSFINQMALGINQFIPPILSHSAGFTTLRQRPDRKGCIWAHSQLCLYFSIECSAICSSFHSSHTGLIQIPKPIFLCMPLLLLFFCSAMFPLWPYIHIHPRVQQLSPKYTLLGTIAGKQACFKFRNTESFKDLRGPKRVLGGLKWLEDNQSI